jgi:hypothetical protein
MSIRNHTCMIQQCEEWGSCDELHIWQDDTMVTTFHVSFEKPDRGAGVVIMPEYVPQLITSLQALYNNWEKEIDDE